MALIGTIDQAGSPWGGTASLAESMPAAVPMPTITTAAAARKSQVVRTVHSRVHSAAPVRANTRQDGTSVPRTGVASAVTVLPPSSSGPARPGPVVVHARAGQRQVGVLQRLGHR